MFIARIGFAVLTRLVLAVKMDIPGRGAEDSDISCEGVSILKRSVPKRLSLFLSALFFALAGMAALFGRAGVLRVGSPEISPKLEKSAKAYLRQTARILGDRYQDDFYRTAVEARLAGFAEPRADEAHCRREYFCRFDRDEALDEALAFLDEVDSGIPARPAEVFYTAGNPLNAMADSLISGIPRYRAVSCRLGRRAGFPLWEWLGFLFSFPFLLTAPFPASPLAEAGGAGTGAIAKFFAGLTSLLSPLFLSAFSDGARSERTFPSLSPRFSPGEKGFAPLRL